MTLPNFLVIGAAKSGTDALCAYLAQHPEIYMSPNREPNFFVAEGQEQIPYCGPGDREAFEALDMWICSLERYEQLFEAAAGYNAIGEGTAWYLYFPEAAERIKRHIPHARLVAILRNPAERAYSAYSMLLGDGRESLSDFSQALAAEGKRAKGGWDPLYRYVDMGFYAKQLRNYFHLFSNEQVKCCIYDDFVEHPANVLHEIFQFLAVDPSFTPDTSRRRNVSMVPRSRTFHRLITGSYGLKQAMKRVLPTPIRRSIRGRLVAHNLRRPDPLDPAIRARLVEIFRPDVVELEALIGRDLSAWLR
jgi:hypothetical protein